MHRRLLVVIVLALTTAVALAGTAGAHTRYDHTRQADAFFGMAVPTPGMTLSNVSLESGKIKAKTITVTADVNGVITGTAALETHEGATVNATFTWESREHWKFEIAANSAPGFVPPTPTAVNLNSISGWFDNVGGEHHANLTLSGYSLGNSTFNIALTVGNGGFEGSAEVNDVVLGGTEYPHLKVTVETAERSVRLEGTMKTSIGTFTVDNYLKGIPYVHAPKSECFTANGKTQCTTVTPADGEAMEVNVSGADLAFKTSSFAITAFHFSTTADIPKSGCATYTAGFGGTIEMKKTAYTISDASIKASCGSITEFKLAIEISHKASPTEIYTGKLFLALDGDGGTFEELTQGKNDNGWQIAKAEKQYGTALLGTLDMSKTRYISKKVEGRTFGRHMTIGMIFGVAIYTPPGSSKYEGYIGAGGYFDADRLSGGFGCSYGSEDSDFSCRGTVRINPSWAGVYRIGVTV